MEKKKVDPKLAAAVEFAVAHHAAVGQTRKGTDVPYIVHPMEVMSILQRMDADTDLLCAGLLHDVVEDTNATLNDVRATFGDRIAELVGAHTEDKSLSWEERKTLSNEHLKTAPREVRMLILADKLSNMRSTASDIYLHGDSEEYWTKYNRDKFSQSWYYSEAIDALEGMQDDPETAWAYWELNSLYKDVFVKFWLDMDRGILYQQACHEDGLAMLRFDAPFWTEVKTYLAGDNIVEVPRGYAERMEDNWVEMPFNSGTAPVQ